MTKSSRLAYCIALLGVYFFVGTSQAQDLHFSQYFNTPLLTNPANTGFEPDADWRAGINYRDQWSGVLNNPYKTMSAWGDAQFFNDRFENAWMGIGTVILKDVAGSGNLSSTKIYGSLAYHQLMGYRSLLSGGFAIGAVNKRIDATKLTSALFDSFQDDLLAPPVYTRPANFRGWEVPDVLLSGNQKQIEEWRHEQSLANTQSRRPGLMQDDPAY